MNYSLPVKLHNLLVEKLSTGKLQTLIIYTSQKQIYVILHTFCPLKD